MRYDAVIVGGGPAGAATAVALSLAGGHVTLVERHAEPCHKVCGEFLSGEAALLLDRLGMSPEALGARPIERLCLSAGRFSATVPLPFAAWSLGRDVLDAALLLSATAAGARVLRGRPVTRLEPGVAIMGDDRLAAEAIVLATGKHDLRGHARRPGGMLAFKQYWRLTPEQARALDGHVELHLFRGGYAGLQPAAEGANLCLIVDPATYARAGSDWAVLLCRIADGAPLLGRRLAGGSALWERPLAVAGQPYGFLADGNDGLYRVGDQLAVIHSYCGEGIVIALDSGLATARRIIAGAPPLTGSRYRRQVLTAQTAARLLGPASVALTAAMPGLIDALARGTRLRAAG